MQSLPLSSSGFDPGREAEALLVAEFAGGRTILRRQQVGYPLHVTRAFHLDAARADLATLYLQSASGGLYARDRLKLSLEVGDGAALNLTTQGATVVHHGKGVGALQRQSIRVGEGAFCAMISDPWVMFPHAELVVRTTAEVAASAVLILADGFAIHDPHQRGEIFSRFSNHTRIMRPDGSPILSDIGSIGGEELAARFGVLGGMAAAATVLVIAPPERLPDIAAIEAAVDACGCLTGATPAPNGAGLAMRIVAPDGGVLTRGIEASFHVAGRAALGIDLARRRK